MDSKATSGTFVFSDLSCILEHIEVLKSKQALVDQKIEEELSTHHIYKHMIKDIESKRINWEKQNVFAEQEKGNLDGVIEELDMMTHVRNQRRYDVETLIIDLKRQMTKDNDKMLGLLNQKEIVLTNEEQESKSILMRMANRLRVIKELKVKLKSLGCQKAEMQTTQEEFL